MQNFAGLTDVKCLHILLLEEWFCLSNTALEVMLSHSFPIFSLYFLYNLGEDADYLYAFGFLKCELK